MPNADPAAILHRLIAAIGDAQAQHMDSTFVLTWREEATEAWLNAYAAAQVHLATAPQPGAVQEPVP